MENHIEIEESSSKRDKGFTLVELLIVIVILGILATVTVFAVRGITDKGQKSACDSDKATLQTATEAYFAQYGTATGIASSTAYAAAAAVVPAQTVWSAGAVIVAPTVPVGSTQWAAGTTPIGSLKAAGLLRSTPTTFFVTSDGQIWYNDAKCGIVGTLAG